MNENELLKTMDAKKWAEEFMERFGNKRDQIDEGLMIAWFANSIMTGWDHAHWKLDPKILKLKQLILLTDESVSTEEMNAISVKQWSEFVKMFPEEGDIK